MVVLRSDVAKISIRPEKFTMAYEDNDVVVYLNRDALTRARIVHVAKQVSSNSTAQMLAAIEKRGKPLFPGASRSSTIRGQPCGHAVERPYCVGDGSLARRVIRLDAGPRPPDHSSGQEAAAGRHSVTAKPR